MKNKLQREKENNFITWILDRYVIRSKQKKKKFHETVTKLQIKIHKKFQITKNQIFFINFTKKQKCKKKRIKIQKTLREETVT